MCLKLLRLPYNGSKLYTNMKRRLVNLVPCGKCYECLLMKTDELMVRSYYESSSSAYSLFDTLTYDEQHVHWHNGRRVLNYKDYQDYMKRFRYYLDKKGLVGVVRYLVSGEYGTTEGLTHRPHYHFILFVKDNSISPLELSRLVALCWPHGRTDGSPYKGDHYVLSQRCFRSTESHHNVVGYCAKYMTKVSKYDKGLPKPYRQFVKWSKGFGSSFLESPEEIRKYESNLYLSLPTDIRHKQYRLPLYYLRKLYYEIDPATNTYRLNQAGHYLRLALQKRLHRQMIDRITASIPLLPFDLQSRVIEITPGVLADYSLIRGYDLTSLSNSDTFDYSSYSLLINTPADRETFKDGLLIHDSSNITSARDYIDRYAVADSEMDFLLDSISSVQLSLSMQIAYTKEQVNDYKRNQSFT